MKRFRSLDSKKSEQRECAHCGTRFEVRYRRDAPVKRFCSSACRIAANDAAIKHKRRVACDFDSWHSDRVCDRCGHTYTPLRRRQRFCSPACSLQHRGDKLRLQRHGT
jgi:hypothetical protein